LGEVPPVVDKYTKEKEQLPNGGEKTGSSEATKESKTPIVGRSALVNEGGYPTKRERRRKSLGSGRQHRGL